MSYSEEEFKFFKDMYAYVLANSEDYTANEIAKASPYSKKINQYIRGLTELSVYTKLNLKESIITRPALLYNIDPDFCICPGIKNIDKMKKGEPPFDAITKEVIHLHHIGQEFSSPFAELPRRFHSSNKYYSILHETRIESWRWNKEYVDATNEEIKQYWINRSKMFI